MSHSHMYNMEQYKRLIDVICECHDRYNKEWLESLDQPPYNLKKKLVRHVTSDDPNNMDDFIDKSFYSYIEFYKEGLNDLYIDIVMNLSDIPIIGRVKNDDSIVSKLHRKRFDNQGNYPLNKYLNDLLGLRIVDLNFAGNFDGLIEHLEFIISDQNRRISYIPRQVGDYKAYHVYFKGKSNHCFPLEFQIWNAKDECKNLDSHAIYKKEYTGWPKTYREG